MSPLYIFFNEFTNTSYLAGLIRHTIIHNQEVVCIQLGEDYDNGADNDVKNIRIYYPDIKKSVKDFNQSEMVKFSTRVMDFLLFNKVISLESEPKFVFTHYSQLGIAAACRKRCKGTIVFFPEHLFCHEMAVQASPKFLSSFISFWIKSQSDNSLASPEERELCQLVDSIVCLGEREKKIMIQLYPESTHKVVLGQMDYPEMPSKLEKMDEYGFSKGDTIVFLSVPSLETPLYQDFLAIVEKNMRGLGPNIRLVFSSQAGVKKVQTIFSNYIGVLSFSPNIQWDQKLAEKASVVITFSLFGAGELIWRQLSLKQNQQTLHVTLKKPIEAFPENVSFFELMTLDSNQISIKENEFQTTFASILN